MSWTAPRTYTTGELITATIGNTHWRDNFLETLAAKVTTAGDIGYATAANALTRLGIGSVFQHLRVASGGAAPEWVGGLSLITDTELGGATASFDFTSISQSYKHLALFLNMRGDTAATSTPALVRLNNVSSASYYSQVAYAAGAGAAGAESIGGTSMSLGSMTAGTGPGNFFSRMMLFLPDYTDASNRPGLIGINGFSLSTASGGTFAQVVFGHLDSAGAVTRITIFPSAGNLATGSRASLYGLN